MKKLIGMGALLLVACQPKVEVSSPTPSTSTVAVGGVGAESASAAVTSFMAAAKTEDLQAIGGIWGTASGPAREAMTRQELEMRSYIIVKCVRHDRYTTLGESNAAGGRRVIGVQITKGQLTKSTNFTLVPGPQSRWFVEKVDLEPLTQICQLP